MLGQVRIVVSRPVPIVESRRHERVHAGLTMRGIPLMMNKLAFRPGALPW